MASVNFYIYGQEKTNATIFHPWEERCGNYSADLQLYVKSLPAYIGVSVTVVTSMAGPGNVPYSISLDNEWNRGTVWISGSAWCATVGMSVGKQISRVGMFDVTYGVDSTNPTGGSTTVFVLLSEDKTITVSATDTLIVDQTSYISVSGVSSSDMVFQSSNTSVLKVSGTTITGIGYGTASIMVSFRGEAKSISIQVLRKLPTLEVLLPNSLIENVDFDLSLIFDSDGDSSIQVPTGISYRKLNNRLFKLNSTYGYKKIVVEVAQTSKYNGISKTINILVKRQQEILVSVNDVIVGVLTDLGIESRNLEGNLTGLENFTLISSSDDLSIVANSVLANKCGIYTLTIYSAGDSNYAESNLVTTLVVSFDNFNPVLIASGGV